MCICILDWSNWKLLTNTARPQFSITLTMICDVYSAPGSTRAGQASTSRHPLGDHRDGLTKRLGDSVPAEPLSQLISGLYTF